MSRANVELIKAVTDYYVRGERDAYLACFAEDVEVRPDVNRFPEAEPFRGREEFRRFLAEVDQTWEGADTAVLKEIFAMGERVVVRADWGGRGRASGVDLRTSLTTISTVQDGQITKIEYFFDHTKALAAAGRSEAPMAQENVKLHYQVYEAVNRRDLAALLALLDADVEYVSGLVAIEGGYHGARRNPPLVGEPARHLPRLHHRCHRHPLPERPDDRNPAQQRPQRG